MEFGTEGGKRAVVGGRELRVPPQHAELHRRFDDVLHHLLRFALLHARPQDAEELEIDELA